MIKFDTPFTDNDKTKLLQKFTQYNSKIDSDNSSDENFDPKTNKITHNHEIKEKGFFAVPKQNNGNGSIFEKSLSAVTARKNDTNFRNQVGFSAVPTKKDGNFKILIVGFSAVPNLNNAYGSSLIFKTGLSAVPIQKKRFKFSRSNGFFRCTQ